MISENNILDTLEILPGTQTNITIHDRPITDVRFNKDGDLLFSASKDASVCLIRPEGQIVGTFDGHIGSIQSIDMTEDSTKLVSGGADKSLLFWDVNSGEKLTHIKYENVVRSVSYVNDNLVLISCDDTFQKKPFLGLVDSRSFETIKQINLKAVPTKAISHFSQNYIVFSDIEGHVHMLDIRTGDEILCKKAHTSRINSLRNSFCKSFFVTASDDAQTKIIDYNDLNEVKSFVSQDPINSAAIFRTNDKIICGGGITARDVATTRIKSNFTVNVYDIVTTEHVGSYLTHFGTINCIDVHPTSSCYASGGEEGIVCIVNFGDDFDEAPFTFFDE
ncbi:hypothetical protein EDEG_01612 [Edhazardia aedis USNM 41457]|uniref:Serine-threonine kinase receptor-associated protein n=1 Tax=Edhazardia aedis (strain USNM 41457) TaxID=1003232 RepID=J9DNI5_EDHAE|nr:hypothetical protein EDEG_01612 [Edhazardia aedis USNM 41457]|eukprot:EJW04090.1 hypothetical protein EDEG_01612 [Edhazardia aedis USNM 41457]